MRRYSANLGFLWSDLSLPAAIAAAAGAGFAAVEVHFPYATPAADLARALERAKLPLIALNTDRGMAGAGEFGLSALPGRTPDAIRAIDAAIAYARLAGAGAVHVMAGNARGPAARAAYLAALEHACDHAPDLTILIEPLNPADAPGYFLNHPDQALDILGALNRPNLRIMADCYHLARIEGLDALPQRLRGLRPCLGHVQFAGLPDRGPPSAALVTLITTLLADIGWEVPHGAEYRPPGRTEDSLGWMRR